MVTGLAHYSYVAILVLRYKFVNFTAKKTEISNEKSFELKLFGNEVHYTA